MNQSSRIGNHLLVDTLLKAGVTIKKIFVPEHGFRGNADAGSHIGNSIDSATHLPIISLYGANKKPLPEQLADIDVVIYDLQDVGARFYTYISTLQYVMEACGENRKRLIILDRPDPNGGYIDGPVLDTSLRSFVGLQPIPVVYAMTPGEYAWMLVGEHAFPHSSHLGLNVITCLNWDHGSRYDLSVAPSPNLRTMDAIYLYPSICLMEGTVISVGRGTNKPFCQWGNPEIPSKGMDHFIPTAQPGASSPPYQSKTCYGRIASSGNIRSAEKHLDLSFLIEMYQKYPGKAHFFTPFFDKLAGTTVLRKQISSGMSEAAIRASWKPELVAFKGVRKKYLLYADF